MIAISKDSHKWWILFVSIMYSCMIFLDQTILPVALPTIQKQFGASNLQLHWMINIYFLTLAVLMITGGKVADYFGHRKMFLFGIVVFGAASIYCASSTTSNSLILARFFQGVGGAIVAPPALPILLAAFPKEKQGFALGLQVSFGSFFLILGPFIGGFFTQYLSWRWGFWINVPLSLLVIFLSMLFVPKDEGKKEKFDFLGFLSFSIGILCLSIALMQGKDWGWFSYKTDLLLIFGVIFLFLLYFTDNRSKNPFIDFSLFKIPLFRIANMNIFTTAFALMITIFWAIYLQKILDFSPFYAGIIIMIATIPVLGVSAISGKMADKKGPKFPILIGKLCILASLLWAAMFLVTNNIWLLIPSMLILSIGVPMVFTPSFSFGIGSIQEGKKGIATGTLFTMRFLGANFGIAILGSVLDDIKNYLFAEKLLRHLPTEHLNPLIFEGLLSQSTKAINAFDKLSVSTQNLIYQLLHDTYVTGFIVTNVTAAFFVLFSLLVLLTYKFKKDTELV